MYPPSLVTNRAILGQGGCHRHNVDCVYDRPAQTSTTTSPASAGSTASPPESYVTGFFDECRDRRYRELRLLHFFIVNICPTLPGTCLSHVLELWRTDAPSLALTYEPLLNGILALSLQGMRWIRTSETPLEDVSIHRARYLEVTLQEHRKAVGLMTRETADSVCLASAVLAIDAFAALQDRQLEPYQPPMEWLQLSRGVRGVFTSVRQLAHDDPNSRAKIMMEYGDAFVKASNSDPASNRAKFAYLLDTIDDETRRSPDGEAYEHTVGYIGSVWAAQQEGQHMLMMARRLLVFSILIHQRFVELVNEYDPRALVILAHFFAVAMPSRQIWWIGRSPAREILAINAYLGAEWRHEMSWPIDMSQR